MNPQVNSQFESILTAAKERRGDMSIDSMIVSSHLSQMRTFIIRRGIEFYCEQDSYGSRKDMLAQLVEENMLEMKLDSIVDYFLCDGQGLFYFRPAGETYKLLYFPKDKYRAYRDQAGDLEFVELCYSFNVKGRGFADPMANPDGRGGKKKYIRLKVYKDRIEQTVSNEKIEFDNEERQLSSAMPGTTEVLANSLGFIPAVEVFNHMDCTGESTGSGEFDWLAHQILYHEELVKNIRKNIKFFGNPTLVSSRPKHDLIEAGDETPFRPTISSQAGFTAMSRPSSRVSEPFGGASPLDGQIKVPRVIANLEPTDRVSYMTPDSVSGDQNLYVRQYRSEIRLALGGVDDIDIGTASTAYEIKTLYGRVAATAEKKARALFTFGLCRLFSMIVQHEEFLFQESFAQALGLQKPDIPLREDFDGDEEAYTVAVEDYKKAEQKFLKKRNDEFRARLESGEMPPGIVGLIPDGSTRVSWRWTGEVFEESTDDILNNSIVVRNLQELGVDSIEALRYLFPGKTDEERAAMLSGFPFRMVQQTQQSFNQFIGLLGSLYQLPHPQIPDQPLASDPNLDITGFLYRSLEFLRKELSYSGKYKSAGDDPGPAKLSDADRKRARIGRKPADERPLDLPGVTPGSGTNPAVPGVGPGSAAFGGESMAAGIPGAQPKPEYQQPVPVPGTTIGVPDAYASGGYPGSMGFGTAAGTSPVFGSPDLSAASYRAAAGSPPINAGAAAGRPAKRTSGRTRAQRS